MTTGVVFLVNINTNPGEPNLLFKQSSVVAVRYVRQRREFLILFNQFSIAVVSSVRQRCEILITSDITGRYVQYRHDLMAVSYTHLDVYKRQTLRNTFMTRELWNAERKSCLLYTSRCV